MNENRKRKFYKILSHVSKIQNQFGLKFFLEKMLGMFKFKIQTVKNFMKISFSNCLQTFQEFSFKKKIDIFYTKALFNAFMI